MKISKVGELLGLPFLFYFFLSSQSYAADHLDKQWLKLLRYRKTYLGNYVSEVDTKTYFTSENGQADPEGELKASIVFLEKKENRCTFPGRYLYLYKKGLLKNKESFDHCPEYKKFLKKINIDSVSIIFSSYFIDKPASAFGHTLFKINNSSRRGADLSDYGVDFSARVTTSNPFLYGLYGIVGGFLGNFNLMPYFLKLREYNDYDSRDLWEFKLKLSQDELDLFAAHLWDMNQARFFYYYFSENCSYHVLGFLDAIVPRYNLIDKVGSFVTPIDTLIPLIETNELVSEVYHRRSLLSRLESRLKLLNKKERMIVRKAFKGESIEKDIKDFSDERKVGVLDTAMDMIDYKHSDQIYLKEGKGVREIQDKKRKVLIARSQVPFRSVMTKKVKVNKGANIGHKTGKAWIGYEASNQSYDDRILLGSRFALHEYREPNGDLYGYFTLQMGRMEAAYLKESKKLRVRRFEIANVEALRPMSFLNKKLSWTFSFGAKNNDVFKRDLGANLDLGLGAAFRLGPFTLSAFWQSDVHQEIKGLDRFSFDVGPKFVVSLPVMENLHLESSFYYVKNIQSGNDFSELVETNAHYYGKDFGLKLQTSFWQSETRSSILLTHFY